jgi:hypothetical protein
MVHAKYAWVVHLHFMLTEIFIEALLVDEDAADQFWETWNAHYLNDGAACIAWMLIADRRNYLIRPLVYRIPEDR